jgi:hypothetical protein
VAGLGSDLKQNLAFLKPSPSIESFKNSLILAFKHITPSAKPRRLIIPGSTKRLICRDLQKTMDFP